MFAHRLRERGFASAIVAVNAEPARCAEVVPFEHVRTTRADAVVYHHATAADLGLAVARRPGRKALIYHGVTPPEFLRPYQPALAQIVAEGRRALPRIAPRFSLRFADSRFGANELRSLGGVDAGVLPFCIDARRFAASKNTRTPARRTTGNGVRWLAVGRIAPNKGLLALVASFGAYVQRDPSALLTLAGAYSLADPYYWALQSAIDAAGVRNRVRLTGSIDDETLVEIYTSHDVYVCLSEHEGFCVPLVEAMMFGLPIVAAANAAVPETLGEAGIIFEHSDAFAVAAVVAELCADAVLYAKVVAAGERRLDAFRPEKTLAAFDRIIDGLLAS